ncbi:flagellar biosynthesis protein FlaG [Paenibacillus sp. H1-7]|uniref:flagellar protein FlaG n=1 Tax=Paenibacillus sp. H1-7 TaxID=2282849 RepID=UPI001EF91039|nr:flagellar protein FlaG [Paenibacillus sp. H1-7]ULL19441.1 flagellar biosynthesis protein FlaG [Paenibacillus sp. H1-7]
MEINLSVGSTEGTGFSRARNESVGTDSSSSVAASVHSARELKEAELRGENIPVSDEQLIKAIERAIKSVEGAATSLQFSVHKETKQILVKVLNQETGEIIREIPPEKNLDMLAKIWERAGIIIDEKR